MRTFFLIGVLLTVASVHAQQPSAPEVLNECWRELGATQVTASLSAQRALTWEQVKRELEEKNPTLVLDLKTKTLTPKEASQ